MIRSVFTVGSATLVSRIVGFAREVLLAAMLGAGPIADAFFVAFRLPNLFRRLFAEGAFNAAFVPLYGRARAEEGEAAAQAFAQDALAVMFWWLLGLSALAILFMPALVAILAPGFLAEPGKFDDAVLFSRICFPYLMCMSLLALYAGVLNSMGRFAAAAWTPVLMNLILAGALLLAGWLGFAERREAAILQSWAVALAGVAQLAMVVWGARRSGVRLKIKRPRLTPAVKRMLALSVPGVISGGVTQINIVVGTMIASTVPAAVSWLYYADRLYQLPLGVVGIAIGTVLLPEMVRQLREGDARVGHTQNRAIELAMLLTLPAAVALAVVPREIVGPLFERGAFTAADTRATAMALSAYAVGLPGFVLNQVFTRGFYAREDMATPMKLAVLGMAVNVAGSLALFPFFGHVGVALATSLAAYVNVGGLALVLHRRGHFAWDELLTRRLGATLAASALMGFFLLLAAPLLWPLLDTQRSFGTKAIGLAILCGGGLALYAAAAWLLGAADHAAFRQALRRRGTKGSGPPDAGA
jgi:putative peptidoglycan lipid II flippase